MKILSTPESLLTRALPVAVKVEEKHRVSERVQEASVKVTQKAKELDEKYAVMETLKGLDQKYGVPSRC